jgi:hypothetical protein
MLTKFFESTGEGFSQRYIDQLFGPAFLFWGGGALILAGRYGFGDIWNWLTALTVSEQTALVILGLLTLTLSSMFMRHLRIFFLRFLEGYWPWPLRGLSAWISRRQGEHLTKRRIEWNQLLDKRDTRKLTALERRRLSDLEVEGHYAPANVDDCLSTVLGNALRAAETATRHRYGLDAVAAWPHLWLILPEDVQKELNAARTQLDMLMELWGWGLLFILWSAWWPWAALISLAWITLTYNFAVRAGRTFADLLLAAVALHRFALYESLNWPRPKNSAEEKMMGEQLTEFLWRGIMPGKIIFRKDD